MKTNKRPHKQKYERWKNGGKIRVKEKQKRLKMKRREQRGRELRERKRDGARKRER